MKKRRKWNAAVSPITKKKRWFRERMVKNGGSKKKQNKTRRVGFPIPTVSLISSHLSSAAVDIGRIFLSRCDTILYCSRQVHSQLNTTTIKTRLPFSSPPPTLPLRTHPTVAHLNIQTAFIVFLCFVHCLLCCHSSAWLLNFKEKAYVNL